MAAEFKRERRTVCSEYKDVSVFLHPDKSVCCLQRTQVLLARDLISSQYQSEPNPIQGQERKNSGGQAHDPMVFVSHENEVCQMVYNRTMSVSVFPKADFL